MSAYDTLTLERCACGGYIRGDYARPSELPGKVTAHRATLRHREWAKLQDWPAPIERRLYNAVVTDRVTGMARLVHVRPDGIVTVGANEHAWGLTDAEGQLVEVVIATVVEVP
jgi:hypothetical protein